ncbi:P-loop containing nucleoside triphosphate hydrolase protein [Mycena alexandri]|uniref:P-loop containing nucleoside triphosphate hydrolase protein n=1 Tax=Mycena alexandri TaxID=1745969 RepID=A0AAD6WVS7_9AGAR|nr:P-loop containing nucleoside triphosphate hydrolase protein [Mycena alexandri]
MALDRDLRALGADMFFDLPSITVIGGQSAGKSSLVEAVSGINVPRDSGTCTRCPMECTMSSLAETWTCKISLRFDYDSLGTKLPDTLGVIPFGPTITDKRAVELWLRRAQAAILSPHLEPQDFWTKTENELRNPPPDAQRLPFSKNAVVVDLSDPKITDLSFVDLPGLIQNERPEVIEVVRDLAVSRITRQNTLILVTIPMSDDIQNQQAARLAKDADPAGERTIAVLTKPDVIGAGATGTRQTWKDTLEGAKDPLTHGYHCVRLPDDDERSRGISGAESERRATEYFDSTLPWKAVADRSRFGVANLTTFLSQLLVTRIETNLPTLRGKLEELLRQTNEELLELPAPPTSEPAAEVLLRVTAFCKAFHAAVFGDDHKSLSQNNRRVYLQFKADIRSTSPNFRPFPRHVDYVNPNITDLEPEDIGVSSHRAENIPIDLLDVRQVIADSTAWELPNHVPFDATKTLVLRFTSQWRSPSITCFESVVTTSAKLLDTLMHSHFSQFTQLETYIRILTQIELEKCHDQALKTLEKLLAFEKLPLFTQNTHQYLTESKAWLARYTSFQTNSWKYLRAEAHTQPGAFVEELVLMANVRAYWQIAYQRIIDYVPLAVEHEFSQRLANSLQEMLFADLLQGPDASAKMQELLIEEPSISTKRGLLKSRIARLEEIKQKLDALS